MMSVNLVKFAKLTHMADRNAGIHAKAVHYVDATPNVAREAINHRVRVNLVSQVIRWLAVDASNAKAIKIAQLKNCATTISVRSHV